MLVAGLVESMMLLRVLVGWRIRLQARDSAGSRAGRVDSVVAGPGGLANSTA